MEKLSIREIRQEDIAPLADYWLHSDPAHMTAMGVDLGKLPGRDELVTMLSAQLSQDYPEKQSYCTIWLADNRPIGHCNVNKIKYGEEAYLHLHIWEKARRGRSLGPALLRQSISMFFENLRLQKIISEPYALNPAPNKTLPRLGFELARTYTCVPGYLNFEQEVNRWELTKERFTRTSE